MSHNAAHFIFFFPPLCVVYTFPLPRRIAPQSPSGRCVEWKITGVCGDPHLAVNSSKVSSACSAFREAETLNGRAATTAERTAKGAGRAAARTMEEPRVAARNRADCMAGTEEKIGGGEPFGTERERERRDWFWCLVAFWAWCRFGRGVLEQRIVRGGGDD